MKKIKLNKRWDITLPDHRADRPEYHNLDGWEGNRLNKMYEVIGKDDLVYYVGAEEGEMPALCQMWGAEVVLFEPNPKVWSNIKAIWEANELDAPLVCFEGFASSITKHKDYDELSLSVAIDESKDFPDSANSEVIGNHGFKELHEEADNYNQFKIDHVAEATKPPSIISIDVEGSEWEVLKGAGQTLKQHKPKIFLSVHPEFMFRIYGEYQYDLRNWIKYFGYKETLLAYEHEVHLYYEPK